MGRGLGLGNRFCGRSLEESRTEDRRGGRYYYDRTSLRCLFGMM